VSNVQCRATRGSGARNGDAYISRIMQSKSSDLPQVPEGGSRVVGEPRAAARAGTADRRVVGRMEREGKLFNKRSLERELQAARCKLPVASCQCVGCASWRMNGSQSVSVTLLASSFQLPGQVSICFLRRLIRELLRAHRGRRLPPNTLVSVEHKCGLGLLGSRPFSPVPSPLPLPPSPPPSSAHGQPQPSAPSAER
jgi:hypothetical protein